MKKIFTTLVVAAAALTAYAQAPTLYLRGSQYGWGADACNETTQFQTTDGETYTLSLESLSGEFKIACADWNAGYNLGSASNIVLDEVYTLVNSGTSGNMNLKEGSATNVTLTLTLSTLEFKISGTSGVFEYPDLYVVGELTGWADPFPEDAKMDRNDNVYTKTYTTFPAGKYKIAAAGWAPNFGANSEGEVFGVGVENICANNGTDITNETELANVTLKFVFNRDGQSTLTLTQATSVDAIAIDNAAEAVYYTIDGVRVENPDKGIYIVKSGNKVSKVIR